MDEFEEDYSELSGDESLEIPAMEDDPLSRELEKRLMLEELEEDYSELSGDESLELPALEDDPLFMRELEEKLMMYEKEEKKGAKGREEKHSSFSSRVPRPGMQRMTKREVAEMMYNKAGPAEDRKRDWRLQDQVMDAINENKSLSDTFYDAFVARGLRSKEISRTHVSMYVPINKLLKNNILESITIREENINSDFYSDYLLDGIEKTISLSIINFQDFRFAPGEIGVTPGMFEKLMNSLAKNKSVRQLYFYDCNLEEKHMSVLGTFLKGNPMLEMLTIVDNLDFPIEDFADGLYGNKNLKELNIIGSIGSQGAEDIARVLHKSNLLTLALENGNLGNRGIEALAKSLETNQSITKLDLSNGRFDVEGAKSIAEMLRNNTNLLELVFGGHGYLEPRELVALSKGLLHNTSLRKLKIKALLNFSENSDAGLAALSLVLRKHKYIQELDLELMHQGEYFFITENTVEHFCQFLRLNQTLQSLTLTIDRITDVLIRNIISCISQNSSIRTLKLQLNLDSVQGAQEIGYMIENNSTLRELVLDDCDISSDGAHFIANSLRNNNTLIKLYLENNDFDDRVYIQFLASLRNNRQIEEINFSEADEKTISHVTQTLIKELLEDNIKEKREITIENLQNYVNPSRDIGNLIVDFL